MPIQLTPEVLRKIWPRAPQGVIDAFVAKQEVLDKVGITHTRTRLAYALSETEHETGGWTIRNLTENINYTPERAAQIWPSRFPGGASQVRAKYGTDTGWQLKMFDDVYGNRMGNRPGTRDGSAYIGRGGPQVTGRNGYEEVGKRAGLNLAGNPNLATLSDNQPAILAAFWSWKNLNPKADAGDYRGVTKLWNGGTIGMADREQLLAGNNPYIARLKVAETIKPLTKELPGSPPTPLPPKEVIDATTVKERGTVAAGTATAGAGGLGEAGRASTEQPASLPAVFSPWVTWGLLGVGLGVLLVAAILLARKKQAVIANWI